MVPVSGDIPIRASDDLTGVGYNADVVNGFGGLLPEPTILTWMFPLLLEIVLRRRRQRSGH